MDYEELYLRILELEKDLKEKLAAAQKAYKNLSRDSERGELKNLQKNLSSLGANIGDFGSVIAEYASLAEGFDAREYMECGDYARQLISYCEKLSVDIDGEYPNYEIFPFKVRIDSDAQEIYVDRKKSQCMRPRYFADTIKNSRDKMIRASFNVEGFLNELAGAYDAAVAQKIKSGKTGKAAGASAGTGVGAGARVGTGASVGASGKEYDILLKDLYNILVPMQRFRKEYDMQSYAFDLARLYNSDVISTKDGRMYEFGPSRQAGKLIRILDKDGKEQFLGTIRFYG